MNIERLKELFEFKDNGLYWKKKPHPKANMVKIGKKAGCLRKNKYRQIRFDNKIYYEHRLIWLYYYGYLPKQIDHINRNPSDNRIENLRECTQSQNCMNSRKKRKGFSSKYKGVCWYKPSKKWQAVIQLNKKQIYLGRFDTKIEAAKVYDEKAIELFGEFAKLNFPRFIL